jgi:hypothetical protein
MEKRTVRTGGIVATDPQGGRYDLDILSDYIVSTVGSAKALSRIKTKDGRHVNRLGKGKYQIMDNGLDLTSDDPNAP